MKNSLSSKSEKEKKIKIRAEINKSETSKTIERPVKLGGVFLKR